MAKGKSKFGSGTKILLVLGGAFLLYHFSPRVRMEVGKLTHGFLNRTSPMPAPMMKGGAKAMLGQGGLSTLTPLYFSGAAITGSSASTLSPGGAARNTLPGVLSTSGFKGKYLNSSGR